MACGYSQVNTLENLFREQSIRNRLDTKASRSNMVYELQNQIRSLSDKIKIVEDKLKDEKDVDNKEKNENEKTIKILVCYHKPFPLLKDEILTPIHLGRKIANKENTGVQWLMENMIGDDTGENISDKNAYYNEMTALYWAWKNYDKLGNPDYIGLAHYRRLFVMEENVSETYSIKEYNQNNIKEVLNYTPEKLKKIVEDCDFVTHLGQVYNLYQHYVDNQRKADIDIAMEILEKGIQNIRKQQMHIWLDKSAISTI